jgi:phosphatidylethanolamine/phosphatidyl-N-methylethanolamine N-methyltransferase
MDKVSQSPDLGFPVPVPSIVARQLFNNVTAATLFVQEWLQRPHQIGAVFPSSKNLSEAMADWLPADPDEYVIELGPGTGSVTHAMLERGLRHDRLIAIEKSPKLAGLLRKRFPRIRVITGDAEHLDKLANRHLRRGQIVGAIISSLPLRIFTPEVAAGIAGKIHNILRAEGKWVQYSYNLSKQRHRGDGRFDLVDSDVIWWNLPPARLSVYQKPVAT